MRLQHPSRRAALALLASPLATGAARAQAVQEDVDLALVLAVDCSSSIDDRDFALQRAGYVAAFNDPRLARAVRGGTRGVIAVTLTQWAGPFEQVQAIGWRAIRDEASARGFARLIAAMPRELSASATSISGAIDHARAVLERSGINAGRRVIDVSGDGMNNTGRLPELARNQAVARGIVINGLPILSDDPNLDDYYTDYVIGGLGAFMLPAVSFRVFAQAILAKLLREVAGNAGDPDEHLL
jgi:hypothetical protein